jgi:hypothetical protein
MADEAGLLMGWEMFRLAKATGRSPWEVWHSPHLSFDLTCQRAHDKVLELRRTMTLDSLKAGDDMGIARILAMQQLIHMDG